jgi:hypothetical protein
MRVAKANPLLALGVDPQVVRLVQSQRYISRGPLTQVVDVAPDISPGDLLYVVTTSVIMCRPGSYSRYA